MKYFIPELTRRNIVMISDYVNPGTYSKDELRDEKVFIQTLCEEIAEYKVKFDYLEIKNLEDLKDSLKKNKNTDTVIFNWCEYLKEKEGTAHLVTEFLESQGFIFSGAGTVCLKLTGSKQSTKEVLIKHGIPTPKYKVIKKSAGIQNDTLNYPLILKLEDRHASAGITNENVIYNKEQLTKVSERLFKEFDADVIAEEFIDGLEYTVTVWNNGPEASCIYITEEIYTDSGISKINTETAKFQHGSSEEKNIASKELNDRIVFLKISKDVIRAFNVLGFTDYGRFEVREKNGIFYIIDCNPNPWIGLDAVLFKGTKKLGYNYGETLLQICEFAVKRYMQ